MAVSIDFNICINSPCDTFTLTEITGAYSASNTTGWGAPNALTSSVTTAVLQATSPSGTVTTFNLLTHSFPSDNYSYQYDILASLLGGYEDGKWDFLLYYTDGVNTYQKRHVYYFYCTTKCCVDTMLANMEILDCEDCKNEQISDFMYAKFLLEGLKYAASCQQENNFNSIKSVLDKLCANSGCKTCN